MQGADPHANKNGCSRHLSGQTALCSLIVSYRVDLLVCVWVQGAEAGAGSSTTANSLPGSSAAGHSEAAASLDPSPGTPQPPASAATGHTTGQTKQTSDGESLEAARKAEKARREAKAGGAASKGQQAQGRGQQAEGKGQQAQGGAQTQPQQQVSRQLRSFRVGTLVH